MSRQRTAAFRDDVRMRNIVLVAGIHHDGDGIVHVFLDGIVHTALAIGRTGAVVIYSQSATNIDNSTG